MAEVQEEYIKVKKANYDYLENCYYDLITLSRRIADMEKVLEPVKEIMPNGLKSLNALKIADIVMNQKKALANVSQDLELITTDIKPIVKRYKSLEPKK